MRLSPEAVVKRCSVKKVFLEISQNSLENICARVSFLIKLQAEAGNFIKKETLAQVFSYEFCEFSKNTFSYRTPPVAASVGPWWEFWTAREWRKKDRLLPMVGILYIDSAESQCVVWQRKMYYIETGEGNMSRTSPGLW